MTITNNERREVARRLRSVDPRTKLEGAELSAKWYEALCAAVGGKRDPWMGIRALCNRLADLIEPEPERTCRIDMPVIDWETGETDYRCSSCGFSADPQDWAETYVYCPNCGARVVQK